MNINQIDKWIVATSLQAGVTLWKTPQGLLLHNHQPSPTQPKFSPVNAPALSILLERMRTPVEEHPFGIELFDLSKCQGLPHYAQLFTLTRRGTPVLGWCDQAKTPDHAAIILNYFPELCVLCVGETYCTSPRIPNFGHFHAHENN